MDNQYFVTSEELLPAYPIKYIQLIPYAAVTANGGTMGRNASPTSLVCVRCYIDIFEEA